MSPVPGFSRRPVRLPQTAQAFVLLATLSSLSLALYIGQFQDTNAYIGIVPLDALAEPGYWLLLVTWLGIAAALFPVRVRCPSDIFLGLYLLGTGLWSASYWPATRLLSLPQAALLGAVLLLPAVLVALAQQFVRRVPIRLPAMPLALHRGHLVPALCGTLLLAALLGYRAAGADGGFAFDEAYLRRLSGRDSFAGQGLAAYLMQMGMNGLAPFLAYVAGLRRSWGTAALALGFSVFSFWLLASKAPVLSVLLLAALGYLVRTGRVVHCVRWLCLAFAGLMVVAVVELVAFDISLIAEFVIRRVILVNSTIQVYFLDALSLTGLGSLLTGGMPTAGYDSPEFFIGATYMGSELTNANTNAFLHQLAVGGIGGYLVVAVGTALLMAVFDVRHVRGRHADGFALATLVGVLLVEQAFFTMLVSSGVLLCLLFCVVFSRAAPTRPRRAALPFRTQ